MVYSERSKVKQAAAARRQAALYTMILAAVLAGGFVVPPIWFLAPVLMVISVSSFAHYDPDAGPHGHALARSRDDGAQFLR
ncbi:MAG: hypothetical protein V3V97_01360 [Hyphomicrobiaceae bacterium]